MLSDSLRALGIASLFGLIGTLAHSPELAYIVLAALTLLGLRYGAMHPQGTSVWLQVAGAFALAVISFALALTAIPLAIDSLTSPVLDFAVGLLTLGLGMAGYGAGLEAGIVLSPAYLALGRAVARLRARWPSSR